MPPKRSHHDRDAEASILGGIFLRPELVATVGLAVDDFASADHQAVWTAMASLSAAGCAVDEVTVAAEMKRRGLADALGLCAELATRVTSAENVVEYAAVVRRYRVERDLRRALVECLEAIDHPDNADDAGMSGAAAVAWCQRRISSIDTRETSRAVGVWPAVKARVGQLERIAEERATGRRTMTGVPTGVAKLDEHLGGAQFGIVTIVAGRPGMGKSALALGLADASSAAGFGAHVFTMEDSLERYCDRVLARQSRIPSQDFIQANLTRGQMTDMNAAMSRIRLRENWLIDESGDLTADEIVRRVLLESEANKTRVVVIDYEQMVKPVNRRAQRHEQIDYDVTTFARLAKLGYAVILLSQLNRKVEERPDKRPGLADLKESGSLEERAKCVVLLYRGAYYGPPVEGVDYRRGTPPPDPEDWQLAIELHVAKNTNGATGIINARWHGPTMVIS